MLDIKYQSRELSKVELYYMTASDDTVSLKDLPDGEKIQVSAFLEATVTREGQKPRDITAILTPDMQVVVTQSPTATRALHEIYDLFGDIGFTVIKKSGVTKNEKPFVNLTLDKESVK